MKTIRARSMTLETSPASGARALALLVAAAFAASACGGTVVDDSGSPEPQGVGCGAPFATPFGEVGTIPSVAALASTPSCGAVVAGELLDLEVSAEDAAPDALLHGIDADGAIRWSRRLGDAAYQAATSVAVDSAGHVLVAGFAEGDIDLGGGVLPDVGVGDLFLAELDDAGGHLWSRRFGCTQPYALAGAAAFDPRGDVIVSGTFGGSLDLGGVPMAGAPLAVFVAKFRADGTFVWSRSFPASGRVQAMPAAIDAEGNVYLTGQFTGAVDFGAGSLFAETSGPSHLPGDDLYLASLSPDGATRWSRSFGGAGFTAYTTRLAATGAGVVLAGMYWGAVDFGLGVLEAGTAEPASGLYLAAFDAEGHAAWSQSFGDGALALPSALVVTRGNIVLAGSAYQATVDFGGGPLASPHGYGDFLARFDADGHHLGSTVRPDAQGSTRTTTAMTADPAGGLLLAGAFSGALGLDGGPTATVPVQSPAGSYQGFVARLH